VRERRGGCWRRSIALAWWDWTLGRWRRKLRQEGRIDKKEKGREKKIKRKGERGERERKKKWRRKKKK
jgi:hypothetical protein